MSDRTNDDVLGIYMSEVPTGGLRGGGVGPTLRVAGGGLLYHRRGGYKRTDFGPVTLVHYSATRCFVINGDAIPDPSATRWQETVRSLIQPPRENQWGNTGARRGFRHRGGRWEPNFDDDLPYVLVPFQALTAAGVDLDTVRPIEVQQDTWGNVRHDVPAPPKVDASSRPNREQGGTRVYERRNRDHVFVTTASRNTIENTWNLSNLWQVRAANIDGIVENRRLERDRNGWFWTERVHHLGGCLFSAVADDGRRHKFVSSFDSHEAPPMYFLAQLPDRSGAKTMVEAIEALKPPLVKKAEADGKRVFRQGDVFAIETGLTDEQVYGQAKTRVRREIALSTVHPDLINRVIRGQREWPTPEDGEVSETIDCPCGCGHKRKSGSGDGARRALSIYRTGHTATEVVVGKGGATYIRGTMFHDPEVEEPGRRPEHRPMPLDEHGTWFLAVRNTVPRRRRQQDPVPELQAA